MKNFICNVFLISLIVLITNSCSNKIENCDEIELINRWSDFNGGLPSIKVSDKKDIDYICSHLNAITEKEDVMVNYSYGYLEISINNSPRYIEIFFTQNHGVLYRIGIGSFGYDDELTDYIMKMLKIKSRFWRESDRI